MEDKCNPLDLPEMAPSLIQHESAQFRKPKIHLEAKKCDMF